MSKKMKKVSVEQCREYIKKYFAERCMPGGGVETNLFWKEAEADGVYEAGTYGSPMSQALLELVVVVDVANVHGEYAYSVFRLREAA